MGKIIHDAMVVTGRDNTDIIEEKAKKHQQEVDAGLKAFLMPLHKAHKKAMGVFTKVDVSPITHGGANGSASFLIPSSGSKNGWETKRKHTKEIEEYIDWLESEMTYGDGSSPLDWAFIKYGETKRKQNDRIERTHNDYFNEQRD